MGWFNLVSYGSRDSWGMSLGSTGYIGLRILRFKGCGIL